MQGWGFDGVDIDLENAPNLQNMTAALRQLRQLAGPELVLTMAPETIYVQPGGSYLQLIDQVRDLVTVVNTQYYISGSMLGRDGRVYSAGTVDFQTALADILPVPKLTARKSLSSRSMDRLPAGPRARRPGPDR